MLRFSRLVHTGLVLLLLFASTVQATPSVWFADDDTLYQADPVSYTLTRRLSMEVNALVADSTGGVWALTHHKLIRFDQDGVSQVVLTRESLEIRGDAVLAADPWDGSLWLSTEKVLLHLDATGAILQRLTTKQQNHKKPNNHHDEEKTVALAAGLDQSVWKLTKRNLIRYSAEGAILANVPLGNLLRGDARYLALDPLNPIIWIATGKRDGDDKDNSKEHERDNDVQPHSLLRLDFSGSKMASLSLAAPALQAMAFTSHNGDPESGRLWGLTNHSLLSYRADGTIEKTINLKSLNIRSASQLTLAPGAGIPWVGYHKGVAAVSAEGVLLASIATHEKVGFVDSTLLRVAPTLSLLSPLNNLITNNTLPNFTLGYGTDCNILPCNFGSRQWAGYQLNATLNDISVGEHFALNPASGQAIWVPTTPLSEGNYRFGAQAYDSFGHATNSVTSTFSIDTTVPSYVDVLPLNGSSFDVASATDSVDITVTGHLSEPGVIRLGSSVMQGPEFSFPVTLQPGTNDLSLFAIDEAGNSAELLLNYTVQVVSPGPSLPPDPSLVATPVDKTVASMLATTTAFIYSGSNPIQTGVIPGTIEPKRAAVLRGKVLGRDSTPLSGVTITVLNHPEFGQTLSRADGAFDMVVNGGGYLTLDYNKEGYLPAQRQINTPWQDFAHASDVVLVALDSKVTAVDLNANTLQVAQGNPVTDTDGTRTATILFPAGSQATMTLADGSTQPLTTLHVRATEYTVGPNGPQSMPGALPPTSGYTYAVEMSVDEAVAAGAKDVQFNQPVPVYIDNFLNFPVGGIVPLGYYDRVKAAWIPSANGRVIKILSIAGGLAELDTNGDGTPDDAVQLATLNITDAERAQLATLYAAGTTLWRVSVTHFTPWDCNWPYGPPPDATPPRQPDPENDKPEDDPDCQGGSIIECQNQILGERLSVTGAPFSLNYRSDRVPGRKNNKVDIPLSGASVPASLRRIELEVSIAGRQFNQTFPVTPNQSYTFEWDGKDAYGRNLQGNQPVNIRVGYVYGAVYQQPVQFAQSFGLASGAPISGNRARQEVTIWQESYNEIAAFNVGNQGLGGWAASIHHQYDPNGKVLFLGDGTRRSASSVSKVLTTIAGNGSYNQGVSIGDGGPATSATIISPSRIITDPQGNLFVSQGARIRKISTDGIITTVAGNGIAGFSGDGGPAVTASIGATDIAFDSQGNLFIAEASNYRIRKVSTDGIITTVAGNGESGFSGDGGLANASSIAPTNIAIDPQGNLFFSERSSNRIRKISTDGIITTMAGNGLLGYGGNGGAATAAKIALQGSIAIDTKGSLYFSEYMYLAPGYYLSIRKVRSDGIISTVVGGNVIRNYDPASVFVPTGIATDAHGNLFFADNWGQRIRKVSTDGIITTVAGNGNQGFSGDGAATAVSLYYPGGVTVDSQGYLFIADSINHRIRKVGLPLSGYGGEDIHIPSADGSELYHFDPAGRHLRTLNAKTGAVLYSFAYDSAGQLIEITDGDGDKTRIERDSAGKPTAIVSADNQRTMLAVDANGYLESVINPAAESYHMTYTADGLLTGFTSPKGNSSSMTYDTFGRLTRDENAGGGFWSLSHNKITNGYETSMSSAEGRTTTYRVENLTTGDQRRTNLQPDGTETIDLTLRNGTTTNTAPDGTITTTIEGPDPRFGIQSPILTSSITKMPSGLTSTVTAARQATLSDPLNLLSLVTQTDTVTVNGKTATVVYDAALKQTTVNSPLNRKVLITNDDMGRVLQAQVANLEPINYAYDTRGRLSSVTQGSGVSARNFSYVYGANGMLESVTDVLGRTTLYQRDAVGRMTQATLPGNRILGMGYDANGNITAIAPPTRPDHTFAYNAVNLTEQVTPPVVGGITDPATRYAWSLDQDLTGITYPDGNVLGLTYDTAGRLSGMTPTTGAGEPITYGYAVNGKLTAITTPEIALTLGYDGFLPTQEVMTGTVAGTLSRGFNTDFRVNQLGINGVATTFAYDADGLLTQAGSLVLQRDSSHGAITGSTLGSLTTTQTYTGFGELDSISATHGSTALFTNQFSHDKGGRILVKTETVLGTTSRYDYGYDQAGRLISASQDGSTIATWGYDANGNRIELNGAPIASVDAQDRLLTYGGTTYTYNARGALEQKIQGADITRFTYDVLGNLKAVVFPGGGRVDYLVDGKNRRIGKKVNGTLIQGFIYQDQLKIAAELDGSNTVVARFIYGERPNVPEYMEKGGTIYRIITDHLGSVRLVVDANTGAIAQRIDYDAWGQMTSDSSPGFQPFGYAGGLYDIDTRLIRFGVRDYDAETGRWTAKDPIGFAGGLNTYSYVRNNPLIYIDPYGLFLCSLLQYLGDLTIDLDAGIGIGLGASGGLSLSSSGISGNVTAGSGIGLGASAGVSGTVNISNINKSGGVGTAVTVTGGAGFGGAAGINAGTGGVSATGTLGFGFGFNITSGFNVYNQILSCEEENPDCS